MASVGDEVVVQGIPGVVIRTVDTPVGQQDYILLDTPTGRWVPDSMVNTAPPGAPPVVPSPMVRPLSVPPAGPGDSHPPAPAPAPAPAPKPPHK